MHPAMIAWWKQARRHAEEGASAGCGASGGGGGCGPSWHGHGHGHEHGHGHGHGGGGPEAFASSDHDGDLGGGAFGVRRPLRFLAHKLDLNDKQVAELARVLDEIKTERAQAAVDNRRTLTGFADAIAGDAFDAEKVGVVASERVKIAERLRDAVVTAIGRFHAILEPEQRAKLAYLIRTGALTL